MKSRIIIFLILFTLSIPLLFLFFKYLSRAGAVKANIVIDTKKTIGPFPDRWKALAQGGEEKGVRMLQNVIPQVAGLYPRYIRLDHIYDYYDVVSRDQNGNLVFNFSKLDETVCDIYNTGAKPFFSLGYMPEVLSGDNTLVSAPKNWNDWSLLVQKTIEHYSGISNRLCGQITGFWKTDIYYEVWNEPDLETFGKWSLYGGEKDYKTLYYYSALGAQKAQNVNRFLIGGPVTTALYQNWIEKFLDYVSQNNLRIDFISWHHYSQKTSDYTDDMIKLNQWLAPAPFAQYRQRPRIISEWGYDSNPNPMADTAAGASHTIASIRNFIDARFEMAFLFEIKDGPTPRWGVLSYKGQEKPRYRALKLLNLLEGRRLAVAGEGTYVSALASISPEKTTVVLVNYDEDNKNTELVPVTLTNLEEGSYTLTISYLEGNTVTIPHIAVTDELRRDILMKANTVIALELKKE
jgi:xylan 1,4-beta-xylosidase